MFLFVSGFFGKLCRSSSAITPPSYSTTLHPAYEKSSAKNFSDSASNYRAVLSVRPVCSESERLSPKRKSTRSVIQRDLIWAKQPLADWNLRASFALVKFSENPVESSEASEITTSEGILSSGDNLQRVFATFSEIRVQSEH